MYIHWICGFASDTGDDPLDKDTCDVYGLIMQNDWFLIAYVMD